MRTFSMGDCCVKGGSGGFVSITAALCEEFRSPGLRRLADLRATGLLEIRDEIGALLRISYIYAHGGPGHNLRGSGEEAVERSSAPHNARALHCLRIRESRHAASPSAEEPAMARSAAILPQRMARQAERIDFLAVPRAPRPSPPTPPAAHHH